MVWPASRSPAPMRAPGVVISFGLGYMAEMEATMTWKAPPAEVICWPGGARVFVAREADVFRILSKRTGVI